MFRPPRALPLAAAIVALALAACDGGGPSGATPTATPAPSTTTPAGVTELGEAPIFYRPYDQFASLRANEAYKILFRITGGYAEDTLRIVATSAAGDTQEFAPPRAEPVGEGDPPGSYYPFNLLLPDPGAWAVTVLAGEDTLTFEVAVKPAATPGA
ncbi:MAG: hypothetical protein HY723_00405 [Chloroflexi bacterium]|nr:hypothetical protein [Chloroflexota bacterium]